MMARAPVAFDSQLMTGRERASTFGRASGRRVWLVPLLALIGRKIWAYVTLYVLHLVLAGIALAYVALRAGTGASDWVFWLSYGWVALQVLTGPRLFLPTALALTVVAVQATQGDRDGWFWLAFTWLAIMILSGGVIMRALRRRSWGAQKGDGAASSADGPEAVFAAMFGKQGFSWSQAGADPTDDDIVDGSAREVPVDLAAELERLAALREAGALTDEEYEQAKKRLLG